MCGILVVEGLVSQENFQKSFQKLRHRGPDHQSIYLFEGGSIGFHRLSIRDLSNNGNQPFFEQQSHIQNEPFICVANGEVYNDKTLRKTIKNQHQFQSQSDCEVILPLYRQLGIVDMARILDAEFVCVIWDPLIKKFLAARDPLGIRPLFYGKTLAGGMAFSSEMKGLIDLCCEIHPFPPAHVWNGFEFIPYENLKHIHGKYETNLSSILPEIKSRLEAAVCKRLITDAPLGLLLSGGLDSSLVCAIAHHSNQSLGYTKLALRTFSIGMREDAIDLKYARQVAEFLGTDHTEVFMSMQEVLSAIEEVIYALETWDITTIRAGLGMFLISRYIRKNTDIKVLLTGEVSDELFGYKYTDFAPNSTSFQQEAVKRIQELYMYDGLRADRSLAYNSLEARVPFSDNSFVKFVMSIDPELKMNKYNMGKYLLRKAFDQSGYLPPEILWREKTAFSDGVGHSMVDEIKLYVADILSAKDLLAAQERYTFCPPISLESLFYRTIFEKYYPGQAAAISGFWMPNPTWNACNVTDPSARVLPNYGKSGI